MTKESAAILLLVPAMRALERCTCTIVNMMLKKTARRRSEEHTSELQSQFHLVCRLLLEKKKTKHATTVFFFFTIPSLRQSPRGGPSYFRGPLAVYRASTTLSSRSLRVHMNPASPNRLL